MGIIKAFSGALEGTFADQWKEIITVENFDEHVIVAPGVQISTNKGRGSNTKGSDGVISNGSRIYVPENTAAFIFDQSGIETIITDPGGYVYDNGQETVFNDKYLSKALTRNELTTPMLGHEPGDKVVENRVEATYEKAGSYEEATYCVRCGRELSRVKVEIPKLTKDEKKDDPKNDNKDKNTQNNQKKNNIKTGDATNVVLLAVLMILSAVIIIGILVLKRRQKSDPNQNS